MAPSSRSNARPDQLGLGQLIGPARRGVSSRCGRAAVVDIHLSHADPALFAKQPPTRVHEDLREPGIEAAAVAQPRELPPSEDAGLLDCVTRIRVAARDGHRHAEQPVEPRSDDGVEGLGFTAGGAFQQRLLGGPEVEPGRDAERSALVRHRRTYGSGSR